MQPDAFLSGRLDLTFTRWPDPAATAAGDLHLAGTESKCGAGAVKSNVATTEHYDPPALDVMCRACFQVRLDQSHIAQKLGVDQDT